MDKGDLLGRHPLGDELLPDVLIDGKSRLWLIQWNCFFQSVKQRINVNQLAYQANARGAATQDEIREAARLVRQAVRLVRDTL